MAVHYVESVYERTKSYEQVLKSDGPCCPGLFSRLTRQLRRGVQRRRQQIDTRLSPEWQTEFLHAHTQLMNRLSELVASHESVHGDHAGTPRTQLRVQIFAGE